jgi:hypothetical protein
MTYTNRRWRAKRSGGEGESRKSTGAAEKRGGTALRVSMGLVILLAAALPAIAKVEVDFIPTWIFPSSKHMPTSAVSNT